MKTTQHKRCRRLNISRKESCETVYITITMHTTPLADTIRTAQVDQLVLRPGTMSDIY